MKRFILQTILGSDTVKEYSTIRIDGAIQEKVFLVQDAQRVDISKHQLLLCLQPIVLGVWLNNDAGSIIDKTRDCQIEITSPSGTTERVVARGHFEYVTDIPETEGTFVILQLKRTRIYHLGFLTTRFLYYKFYKKPGLTFEKLKALVFVYSYPRKVRLVSFTDAEYYNIFPMDLLGEISGNRFAFGLRHTNKSLGKIIECKKVVASDVSAAFKSIIYQLGAHHGSVPPALKDLPFRTKPSRKWSFNIPESVNNYKEIQIHDTINLGSHMLLWGQYDNDERAAPPESSLYHIHFVMNLFKLRAKNVYQEI